MIIRYSDGSYAHGVIYRLIGGTLRAAVAGVDDAVEFRFIRGDWSSDKGIVVTFEFPIETGMDFVPIMPGTSLSQKQARCAAGGDCVLRRMAPLSGSDPVN